jgi:hypothetical protein
VSAEHHGDGAAASLSGRYVRLGLLAIHETYPGHHVERCCKEQLLVQGRGLVEETIVTSLSPLRLGGFEPPTNGLEGRCSVH